MPLVTFAVRLYAMLQKDDKESLHWSENGDAIMLKECQATDVARQLRLADKSSLSRRMKEYGFVRTVRWIPSISETCFVYTHMFFRRGSECFELRRMLDNSEYSWRPKKRRRVRSRSPLPPIEYVPL